MITEVSRLGGDSRLRVRHPTGRATTWAVHRASGGGPVARRSGAGRSTPALGSSSRTHRYRPTRSPTSSGPSPCRPPRLPGRGPLVDVLTRRRCRTTELRRVRRPRVAARHRRPVAHVPLDPGRSRGRGHRYPRQRCRRRHLTPPPRTGSGPQPDRNPHQPQGIRGRRRTDVRPQQRHRRHRLRSRIPRRSRHPRRRIRQHDRRVVKDPVSAAVHEASALIRHTLTSVSPQWVGSTRLRLHPLQVALGRVCHHPQSEREHGTTVPFCS